MQVNLRIGSNSKLLCFTLFNDINVETGTGNSFHYNNDDNDNYTGLGYWVLFSGNYQNVLFYHTTSAGHPRFHS